MDQNYYHLTVRSSAVLTNSYVAGTVLGTVNSVPDPSLRNQLVIYANFTLGNLTSASIKVEFSHDNTTFFQESFSSITTGTDTVSLGIHTLTATGKYRIAIPMKDQFVKISVIGTGDTTNSLMAVEAIIGTT